MLRRILIAVAALCAGLFSVPAVADDCSDLKTLIAEGGEWFVNLPITASSMKFFGAAHCDRSFFNKHNEDRVQVQCEIQYNRNVATLSLMRARAEQFSRAVKACDLPFSKNKWSVDLAEEFDDAALNAKSLKSLSLKPLIDEKSYYSGDYALDFDTPFSGHLNMELAFQAWDEHDGTLRITVLRRVISEPSAHGPVRSKVEQSEGAKLSPAPPRALRAANYILGIREVCNEFFAGNRRKLDDSYCACIALSAKGHITDADIRWLYENFSEDALRKLDPDYPGFARQRAICQAQAEAREEE